MKVFAYDFKTGKRGKKALADKFYSGTGTGIGIHNGKVVHEHFLGKVDTKNKTNPVEHFTADDFGVNAIMCCSGCVNGKWQWFIVCKKETAEKAKARNKRLFGHEHWSFKDGDI